MAQGMLFGCSSNAGAQKEVWREQLQLKPSSLRSLRSFAVNGALLVPGAAMPGRRLKFYLQVTALVVWGCFPALPSWILSTRSAGSPSLLRILLFFKLPFQGAGGWVRLSPRCFGLKSFWLPRCRQGARKAEPQQLNSPQPSPLCLY